jgi:hypothetical protein
VYHGLFPFSAPVAAAGRKAIDPCVTCDAGLFPLLTSGHGERQKSDFF